MEEGMTWQLTVVVAVSLFASLTPNAVSAQGASVGSITGVAKDSSGAVLPGVTVEASSPALIEKVRTTVTDGDGHYQIIELSPGTYTVLFVLPGFTQFRREGIVLTTNFTATVNATMGVGSLEETITVSGASPLVDTRNVTQQQTITQEVLNVVPTSKTMLAMAALIPAASIAPSAQDVGGSRGEATGRISIHGSKPNAATVLLDGLSYNRTASATGRSFMINPLGAQEVVLDLGAGGSAEYSAPGVTMNLIPRDGANKFTTTFFAAGTNSALQSDNLTDALKAKGLRTVNKMMAIYDLNVVVGGPIRQDKLWFSTSHRNWGRSERIANLFHDSNLKDFLFTPDFNRPVDANEDFRHHDVRITWQIAASHKLNASISNQHNNQADNFATLSPGTRALDANTPWCDKITIFESTWTHPRSNRLLFEGGYLFQLDSSSKFDNPCVGSPYNIMIRETSNNFTYGGQGVATIAKARMQTARFSTSYVTGAHHFKTGIRTFDNLWAKPGYSERPGFLPVMYTLTNGVPVSLTEYASPLTNSFGKHITLGMFAQDQWQMNRLTLTGGLRFEYVNAWSPAVNQLGGLLVDAASFPGASCLPCWRDLNPRIGASLDIFGNGKTALKAAVGRYVQLMNVELADQFGPWNAVVTSTSRSWTDSNSDFYPNCDLRNPELNLECGPMTNKAFGKAVITTRPDPDWITGWGKRGYTWMGSLSMDHELAPGVSVNAGYYRTWSGNFTVTDNRAVTPKDYDPYCITGPVDSRLPADISGQKICGFYDISEAKFGVVDNFVTLAKNFGKQTEIYNGADAQFTARLPKGAQLAGGWNVGNSVSVLVNFPGDTTAKTNNCFVVDSPQQLHNCESTNPYRHQFRMNGSIPLPRDVQMALVYQNLVGTNQTALYTVRTADIKPTLGRDLAGRTSNATLDLYPPFTYFEDGRINQLDARFSKLFNAGKKRIRANFDIYNTLNNAAVLQVRGTYNTTNWLQPTQILNARLFKLSFQVDF
jgi:hypothetical protein